MVPAQDSSAEDRDSEEEEEEEEAEEGPMEGHWVPEEGAGQGLAHRLHQEGELRASEPPGRARLRGRVLSHPPLSPGLAGPLQWLENCLRRTAGDREEDGEQAGCWGGGQGGGQGRAVTVVSAQVCPTQCR